MNFIKFNVLNYKNVLFKPKICYFIVPTKQYSTTAKPLLRSQQKIKNIGPFGWFLLIIPVSTFSLGVWQVRRKKWKEDLIQNLQTLTNSDPVSLPQNMEDIKELEFKPVHVKGYFLHDKELYMGPRSLLVKGDASTQSSLISGKLNKSAGYQVITPFKLADRDEIILVNRGWVPAKHKDQKTRQKGQIEGLVDIIGIVRLHENRPTFTPKNQGSNIYCYRDLQEMASRAGTSPIFLDATNEFDVPDGPIGGQTRISLRNEHLSYILTWFSLCGATSYMWYKKFIK